MSERRLRGRDGPQGPDGRQGLDGRDGEVGHQGERGESMPGERGVRGPEGHAGRAGPLGVGIAVVLLCFMTFGWWASEYHACQRTNTTRSAVRIFAQTAFDARTAAARLDRSRRDKAAYRVDHGAALKYAQPIMRASALDCSGLFPDAK